MFSTTKAVAFASTTTMDTCPLKLFCFTVLSMSDTYTRLLMAQVENRASLFACDEHMAITAGGKLKLGQSWLTYQINPLVGKPALDNIAVMFKHAWDAVIKDSRFRMADWTVKVDPDTVFFPRRLCRHLSDLQLPPENRLFVTNCGRYPGPPKMFGGLEVFTRPAVEAYAWGMNKCRRELEYTKMPEDEFMQQCLYMLGVSSFFDDQLVGDERCWPTNCTNITRAAYHAYADVGKYMTCWEESSFEEDRDNLPMDTIDAKVRLLKRSLFHALGPW